MDAMMTVGQIAGTLIFSLCAAFGIQWIFLASAFRLISSAIARPAAVRPIGTRNELRVRSPALWT